MRNSNIIIAIFLVLFIVSCNNNDNIGEVKPVTNAMATPFIGSVKLSWTAPSDSNYYYTLITYKDSEGKIAHKKVSRYDVVKGLTSTTIGGFTDVNAHDFILTTHSSSGASSSEVKVTCTPQDASVAKDYVLGTVKVYPKEEAASVQWENESGVDVKLIITYTDMKSIINRDTVDAQKADSIILNGLQTTTNIVIVAYNKEDPTKTVSKTLSVVPKPITVPDRIDSWLFDDPTNLLKAEIGQDLETGWRENVSPRVTHIPSPNGMTGFIPISGPDNSDKAVTVDKWHFFVANHGISPNGGGTRVNEYTLMINFRVPSLGVWYTFLQTNPADDDDGDIFINPSGAIGCGVTGYSNVGAVVANKWQRLVISVKLGDNGWIKYYLDGKLILYDGNMTNSQIDNTDNTCFYKTNFQIDDTRFSLSPQIILFGDDDGDDAAIDVAEVAMWNVALDERHIEKLYD